MSKPKIIAHTLARNEQRWIWYAIMSVIDYVDELHVWDASSTDLTAKVVQSISHPKLHFKSVPPTPDETVLSATRTHMLNQTSGDWLLILDADEIWPESSIAQAVTFIQGHPNDYDSIVVPTLNFLGDVYHVSPPQAGQYRLAGRVGHYNLRFINLSIPGLHVANPPGQLQSYFDSDSTALQNRDANRIVFLDTPYLHATHLARSQTPAGDTQIYWRAVKKKIELGQSLPANFVYPTCFYFVPPSLVLSPWQPMSLGFYLAALVVTPLKYIRRLFTTH